jgi:hypothetical protein
MRVLRPDPTDLHRRAILAGAPPVEAVPPAPVHVPARPAAAPRRRMGRIGVPVLAAGILAPVAMAFGAAWTLPRGTTQAIVTTAVTQGSRYVPADGPTQRIPEYRKVETQALVEHGLTDELTLIAAPSFLRTHTGGATADAYAGLGFTDLGARVRLWTDGSTVLSAQAVARIPGPRDGRRPAEFGQADTQGDFRLLAGHGFKVGEMDAYANAELALRHRAGAPPDEVRADFTIGLRPDADWTLLAQSFNVVSTGERGPGWTHYWFSKAQLSVLRDLGDGWALQAGAFTTVAARGALRENGAVLAVWKRF